jgi:hypothetical protein|tara:strand:- start:59 stop:250 length:192 start_codon:yes stop_codon:yes gene_type:complete
MATNLEAIVDADDYRIFNDKIGIAQSKGVEIPHLVESLGENSYKITLLNNTYTIEELDKLTEE